LKFFGTPSSTKPNFCQKGLQKMVTPTKFEHEPVLLQEVVKNLTSLCVNAENREIPEQIHIVDGTLGGAGHATALISEIFRLSPQAKIKFYGFDQDARAVASSTAQLEKLKAEHKDLDSTIFRDNFRNIENHLTENQKIDILLADLGVSSPQLDDPERGFSVRATNPIDMRMNQSSDVDAQELLMKSDLATLDFIFRNFGEEPRSKHLAACIVADRETGRLPAQSGLELSRYIDRVLGYRNSRSSPSIRIFQALRIVVNDELGALGDLLSAIPRLMNRDWGKVGLISFHSLEDRAVKTALRHWEEAPISLGCEFPRGGIVATDRENANNPRARSARLRVFCFGETRKSARSRAKKE
jgi:16S rRNA (cytosine1402-N4)-methyltransferase